MRYVYGDVAPDQFEEWEAEQARIREALARGREREIFDRARVRAEVYRVAARIPLHELTATRLLNEVKAAGYDLGEAWSPLGQHQLDTIFEYLDGIRDGSITHQHRIPAH